MKWRAYKYLAAFSIPMLVAISFTNVGWLTFLPVIFSFVFIPGLELLIKTKTDDLSAAEAEMVSVDRIYDLLIWMVIPIQCGFLIWFLFNIQALELFSTSWWGRSLSMGLMCGVLGINVAHELGHRRSKAERFFSKVLLMTSLYPHFYIEHNYGHHKNVATPADAATARYKETLYRFWVRSIFYSYLNAWQIEKNKLKRIKRSFYSFNNEMIWFLIIEIILTISIILTFGPIALFGFLFAALVGILLLETVNYIEHYGLMRKKVSARRHEDTSITHSWNSKHVLGRVLLFEVSRHSDHHAHPHKKYQSLETYKESPQMPTGYPGMMLLSTIPPLWFKVMNKEVDRFREIG